MCRPASFVVTKKGVYWSKTSDSHEEIIREHKLEALDRDPIRGSGLVRVEITPQDDDLSLPLGQWRYRVDQHQTPDWYVAESAEKECRDALVEWSKAKLTGWNVHEAFHPVNPLKVERKPMDTDKLKELVRQWASVRASVRDSVGGSVRASVGDSVWASVEGSVWDSVWDSVRASVEGSVRDSVRAYIGGLFPCIAKWKYAESLGADPWRPLLTLWYAGYVPSFDGRIWRLHAGPKADVVWSCKASELTGGCGCQQQGDTNED